MNKPKIFLLVFLYAISMPIIIGQTKTGEIIIDNNGKYILKEYGLIEYSWYYNETKEKKDSSNSAYHNHLPVGSEIQIFNNDSNTSIKATIKGKLKRPGKGVVLQLGKTAFTRLYRTNSDLFQKHEKPGVISFITPIDSLLDQLRIQNDSTKFGTYNGLVKYYKHYHPQKALGYAKEKIALSKKMGSLEKEAEAWLFMGDLQNDMVEKEVVAPSWPDYSNPEKLIKAMATKLGYPQEDIVRWNRLGGNYFYLQSLFHYRSDIVAYPKPGQFTDVAFKKYLKIAERLKDPDKIVSALKKIGDLQRLKTGHGAAEPYYLRMLKIREEGNSEDKKSWVWGYLAGFYWEQKNYTKAEKYFQKLYALRQSTSLKDPERLIWAIGGLRNLRYTEGKIAEALELQRQLFPLYKKVNNTRRKAILKVIIRDYLQVFKDQQEEVLQSLIKWYNNDAGEDFEKHILARNIAEIYANKSNFGKAAEFTALTIPFINDSSEKIRKINDVAFYYQKDSAFEKSLDYYKKALSITQEMDDKILEAIQYYKIAYFYDYQQKTEEANTWYRKVLNTLKLIPDDSVFNYGYDTPTSQLQQILKYQIHKKKWGTHFAEECIRIHKNSYTKRSFEDLLRGVR